MEIIVERLEGVRMTEEIWIYEIESYMKVAGMND